MGSTRFWLVTALTLSLSACGLVRDQIDPGTVSIRGVSATLEQLNTVSHMKARDDLVQDLTREAGFAAGTSLQPYDKNWALVTRAGIYEIGRQCDQYLDALFRFNREQRAGREGLAAVAATTAAVMGLTGFGAKTIAITAALFGLSASLFDASVNSVLFTIESSALRNVVLQGRQNYLKSLAKSEINTRPDMMIALQGYLTQCSPAAIEANINNAANGSLNAVTSPVEEQAEKAAALAAPALTLTQRAQGVIESPFVSEPLPLPQEVKPGGLLPEERHITISDLHRVQAALGIPETATLGPPGSETRTAIAEFQEGLHRRNSARWPDFEVTGHLAGRTGPLLLSMSEMPKNLFASPFERAFLGNEGGPLKGLYTRVDPVRLDALLQTLFKVPATTLPQGTSPAEIADRIALLRAKTTEARRQAGSPPGPSQALDSKLYTFLSPKQPLGPE